MPENPRSRRPDAQPPAQGGREAALLAAAADTERHVARAGWDQPMRMFALVPNALLAEREPSMGEQLASADPDGFTAVEQDGLPSSSHVESVLARVAWPPDVAGVALTLERVVVPPEAERDLPSDPEEATDALARHPDRRDVRLTVAVERGGSSVCLLRQRQYDSDDAVAVGPDLAPGVVHALFMTLEDDAVAPESGS